MTDLQAAATNICDRISCRTFEDDGVSEMAAALIDWRPFQHIIAALQAAARGCEVDGARDCECPGCLAKRALAEITK